jgi:hypothetical protein
VRIAPVDLRRITDQVDSIEITATDEELSRTAATIEDALNLYALFRGMDRNEPSRDEVAVWASAVARWVSEGFVLLGGNRDQALADREFPSGRNRAVMHLLEGWLRSYGEEDRPLRLETYTLWREFTGFFVPEEMPGLQDWERGDKGKTGSGDAGQDLVRRLSAGLELLGKLAAVLSRRVEARPLRTRPRKDAERYLVGSLAGLFERLYGLRYAFPNTDKEPGQRNARGNLPSGPALEWTRALFALTAERARGTEAGENFAALAAWAKTSDALADTLRPRRERGKSPAIGARISPEDR